MLGLADGLGEALFPSVFVAGEGVADADADAVAEALALPDGAGEAGSVLDAEADGVGDGLAKRVGVAVTGDGAPSGGGTGWAETAVPVLVPPTSRAMTSPTSSTAAAMTRRRRTQ